MRRGTEHERKGGDGGITEKTHLAILSIELFSVDVEHPAGTARLRVPAAAARAAGFGAGDRYLADRAPDGRVRVRTAMTKAKGTREFPDTDVDCCHLLAFQTARAGLPSAEFPETPARVHVADGALLVTVPDSMPAKTVCAVERDVEKRDLREATAGLTGAAYSLALDSNRIGRRTKATGTEQLVTLLRDAGHRVERLSSRLWRLDGQTVSLPDLVEAGHQVDAEAVLVAA